MTNNYYYLAGANLKGSLSSLPALALVLFVTLHSAALNAHGTSPDGKPDQPQSGQTPKALWDGDGTCCE